MMGIRYKSILFDPCDASMSTVQHNVAFFGWNNQRLHRPSAWLEESYSALDTNACASWLVGLSTFMIVQQNVADGAMVRPTTGSALATRQQAAGDSQIGSARLTRPGAAADQCPPRPAETRRAPAGSFRGPRDATSAGLVEKIAGRGGARAPRAPRPGGPAPRGLLPASAAPCFVPTVAHQAAGHDPCAAH
jgi:hypothetical protein